MAFKRSATCVAVLAALSLCGSAGSKLHAQTAANAPAPAAPSLQGRITVPTGEGSANSLAGVEVKLTPTTAGAEPRTAVTDDDGHYEFAQLTPGIYTLEVTQDGFAPMSETFTISPGQPVTKDIVLQIVTVNQQLEVHAEATEATTQSVTPNASVSDTQLTSLPLPTQKFTEALSLVPGVIRTAEGHLAINGQAESQGMLLVDSAENVDPISGSFAIPVPVDAIQSMTVYSLPESSGYGGFSGGLTAIETKPPSDVWQYNLFDFIPSFRGKNDHLVGVENWAPRLQFAGPLLKDKVNFSEEVTYEFRRTPIRGLAWPENETVTRSTTSFTQLQVIWSPKHLFSVNVNVFPLGTEFANINALIPQSASTTFHRDGVSAGASDTYQFDSGAIFNATFRYTRFDSNAYGQGPADMILSPSGWGGNYFNSDTRAANQIEGLPSYQLAPKKWFGRHEIRFGADALYRSYAGTSLSHPIDILANDGSLAEQISFQGAGRLSASDSEIAEFVEDHWTVNSHLSLNFGGRLSSQSIGRDAAFAPRAGFAYAPDKAGKTVIRASAAEVYSHVPLLAADFADNQERILSFYNSSGILIGQPEILQNAYLLTGVPSAAPGANVDPGTSPRTFSWNAEFEREVNRNLTFRATYLDSHTTGLFVVNEELNTSGSNGLLALENTGVAHYRQAQANVHYRPSDRADLNFSYTWSRATGDLNTLSDALVPFASPIIRPDVAGVLPSDVPQRFLVSGLLHLPKGFFFSPVVDVHSGLPFSPVDVFQNYVGAPDSERYPAYFSLDVRVYREFSLRRFLGEKAKGRKIRIGVYSTDVTGHQNPNAVYNNVTSPDFGQFVGFQKRIEGAVLDLVP